MGKKRARSKATASQYPNDGPATIPVAYSELTPPAFAVWLRLMVESRDVLRIGRRKLAGLLDYSEKRSNVILRELYLKGYVSFVPNGPGRPTEIIIERRALISARDGFVRLSNALSDFNEWATISESDTEYPTNLVPTYLPTVRAGLTHGASRTYPRHQPDLLTVRGRGPSNYGGGKPGFSLSSSIRSGPIVRRKFVAVGVYGPIRPAPTREDIREKYKRKREEQKKKRRAERSEAERRRIARNKVRGTSPGSIDWPRLDQRGNPSVSFEPSAADRKRLVEVLNRKPRDSERKRVVAKIATEFGRIYTRYRRQAERRMGRSYSEYEVIDSERKYAAEAGIWCIRKGVTPRQVLEYWDRNIKHFADGSMALPPLSFLRWPANIDRVACSVLSDGKGKRQSGHPRQAPAPSAKPAGGNSFSEIQGLDVRLRSALNDAGFDTVEFNDRYLLGIQYNAMAIASGERIFMGESRAKRMAVWAAENLYAG